MLLRMEFNPTHVCLHVDNKVMWVCATCDGRQARVDFVLLTAADRRAVFDMGPQSLHPYCISTAPIPKHFSVQVLCWHSMPHTHRH